MTRSQLIRLAYVNPSVRGHLFQVLSSDPFITKSYLQKLVTIAEQKENPKAYSPMAAIVLQKLLRSMDFGNIDPFPVSELWDYLNDRNVDPLEVSILKEIPLPRPAAKSKRVPFFDAISSLEGVSGKSVVYNIWIDDPDVDKWSEAILGWTKALKQLSKYHRAWGLFQSEVKRIHLSDKPRGSEDASWDAGGVLFISLKDPKAANVAFLVHEMGHALEDKLDLTITAWDETPYGNPPFVSSYAEMNAAEDFAETFRVLEMEPSVLKRACPTKWFDMIKRVQ